MSEIKFTVYANCQSGPMGLMVSRLLSGAQLVPCPAVHTIAPSGRAALMDTMASVDVVVHQPIGANLVAPIEEIKEEFPGKTFVSFPSIHFNGLFPQLCTLRHPTDGIIKGPLVAYHDARVIRSFLRGETVDQCLGSLGKADGSFSAAAFASVLATSKAREADLDVQCMDIVERDFQKLQLFYTFNHPANHLLWQVAERIVACLGHRPNAVAAPPKPYLDAVVSAVPSLMADALKLNWRQDRYRVGGEELRDADVVASSYEIYARYSEFGAICRQNKDRFSIPVL